VAVLMLRQVTYTVMIVILIREHDHRSQSTGNFSRPCKSWCVLLHIV